MPCLDIGSVCEYMALSAVHKTSGNYFQVHVLAVTKVWPPTALMRREDQY